MNIYDLVKDALSAKTPFIDLSPQNRDFIERIVKEAPEDFKRPLKILSNGTLDPKDMPELVLTTAGLYTAQIRGTDVNVDIIKVVEFTLNVIISTLNITEEEKVILRTVLKYSTELLIVQVPRIEKYEKEQYGKCMVWLSSIYKRSPPVVKPDTQVQTQVPTIQKV